MKNNRQFNQKKDVSYNSHLTTFQREMAVVGLHNALSDVLSLFGDDELVKVLNDWLATRFDKSYQIKTKYED